MFSIIDNEIKVNFEILGGTTTQAAAVQGPPGVGGQTPVQSSATGTGTGTGPSAEQLANGLVEYGLTLDNFKALMNVTEVKAVLDRENVTVDIFKAAAMKGGSLDDALFKDIQLPLIGGVSVDDFVKEVYVAAIRAGKASLVSGMMNAKSDAWLSKYNQVGDLSGSNAEMNEITRRVNGVLQVKNPTTGKYDSLDDYWKTSGQSNGAKQSLASLKCFMEGESMWNDDGSAAGNSECVNALKSKDLWKTTVADMHPKEVFSILKSAGFKGENSSDGKVRCQSYDSWRSSLNENQKKELGITATSTQFVNANFLKNLVAFVNANPNILNAGDLGLNAPLDSYGVRAATHNKRVDHSFDDLRYRINSAYDTVRFRVHGLTGALPMGFNPFSHAGGAPSFLFPSKSGNKVENLPRFSAQLRTIYKSMVSRLRVKNKTLAETTKTNIEKIFSSLEKHEQEAVVLITQLEKYNLVNGSNRNPAEISDAAMTKAVDNFEKTMGKLRKRSINIIDIESVLNTAVNDAESAQSNFGSL